MPIEKQPGESKDEFISRCIAVEINAGKPEDQAAAICYAKWEDFKGATPSYNEPPVNQELLNQRVSFDYDDTISTLRGQALAKMEIAKGNQVYIISARQFPGTMYSIADQLEIPRARVIATGSNKAKIEKIKELKIVKHWDNNADVIRQLGSIGQKFSASAIFSSDADKDLVKYYLENGWDIYIKADGKLLKKSDKAHQIVKELGLSSNKIVFNNQKDYTLDFTEGDPQMTYLKKKGKDKKKYKILKSVPLENGFDLRKISEIESDLMKDVDLKFLRVETKFSYELRPDALPAASGSRPFCRAVLAENKLWSLEEINGMIGVGFGGNLPVGDQAVSNPFLYTGGFYTRPGGKRGPDTTPYCRHMWKLNLVVAQ